MSTARIIQGRAAESPFAHATNSVADAVETCGWDNWRAECAGAKVDYSRPEYPVMRMEVAPTFTT